MYSTVKISLTFSKYQTAWVVVRRTVADPKFLKTIVN